MRTILHLIFLVLVMVSWVAGTSLEQGVAEQLIRDYNLDTAYVRISIVHADITITDLSGYEVKVVPLVASEPKGRFPVRIEVYQNGTLIEKGAASLDIRRLMDVLVPTRGIKRNEPLSADLFSSKRIDVTSLYENVLSDPSQLSGCRARQELAPDRFVSLARLERIPDIESGRPVTIIAGDGQLEVRAQGIALQNGRIGDIIQIRNADSKKILMGRVTAAGVVQISI